jgi:hypothetical protein
MGERGNASMVMVGFIITAIIVSTLLVGAAHQLNTSIRLQGATDRAALGAAEALVGVSPWLPCDVAREILGGEGFLLGSCELEARSARVVGKSAQSGFSLTKRAHAGVPGSGQE